MLERVFSLAIHLAITVSMIGSAHLAIEGHIADAIQCSIVGAICVIILALAEWVADNMRRKG